MRIERRILPDVVQDGVSILAPLVDVVCKMLCIRVRMPFHCLKESLVLFQGIFRRLEIILTTSTA